MKRGTLILEDGSEFAGTVFGATANTTGEVGKTVTDHALFATMSSPFSLSNGHGGLQRISYRSIVLWRDSRAHFSTDWQLW